MTPEQQAQIIIEDFIDIVDDFEKAKECSIYFVQKVIKLQKSQYKFGFEEWWEEVLKSVKICLA